MIDSQSLKTKGKREYFSVIPESKIANMRHLSERSKQACGNRGLPYAWGTIGLAYRSSANPNGIDSWKQLFSISPANQQKTIMLDDSLDSTIIALIAAGHSPFSTDVNHLKEAYRLLQQQSPLLHSYGYGLSYAIDKENRSEITLAVAYSGDIAQFIAATGQNDWRYTVSIEGAVIWTDCFAMPHGSGSLKTATLEFLDFINRPDIAAINAETIWLATPNLAAIKLTRQDYQQNEELFPSQEIINRSHYYKTLPNENLKIRSRMLRKLIPYSQYP